jgi:hypothetical protein
MSEPVFVIRNQHGFYLTRQNEWADGHDPAPLFRTAYRDVALNTLIELNARDIELRGSIIEVEVNEKGLPKIEPADAVTIAAAADARTDETGAAPVTGDTGQAQEPLAADAGALQQADA